MLESKTFEKVLVDDQCARRNNGINKVFVDEVEDNALQTSRKDRPSQNKNNAAIVVRQHHFIDLRSTVQVARGKCHVTHRLDQRDDLVLFDVQMDDCFLEKIGFGPRHDSFGFGISRRLRSLNG